MPIMLDDQINNVASMILGAVDIDILSNFSEDESKLLLCDAIQKIDRIIEDVLPNVIMRRMHDDTAGLRNMNITSLDECVRKVIDKKFDTCIFTSEEKEIFVDIITHVYMSSLRKDFTIEHAIKERKGE